jgi:hypothetical protein
MSIVSESLKTLIYLNLLLNILEFEFEGAQMVN